MIRCGMRRVLCGMLLMVVVSVSCLWEIPAAAEDGQFLITGLRYTDASGRQDQLDLANSEELYVTANVTNIAAADPQATLIAALYDETGALVCVDFQEMQVPVGKTQEETVGFALPAGTDNGYTLKLFLWDNLVDVCPLAKSEAFQSQKLLSGNTLGGLLASSTTAAETDVSVSWVADGDFPTDAALMAAGADFMVDGAEAATATTGTGDVFATLLYDLGTVQKVMGAMVWADAGMETMEVYASLDGTMYHKLEQVENPNSEDVIARVTYAPAAAAYARYVKLVLRKAEGAASMQLAESAIFGDAAAEMSLLTDNAGTAGSSYDGVPKIETGATYLWKTEDPGIQVITGMADTDGEKEEGAEVPQPNAAPNDNLTDGNETSIDKAYTCQGGWKTGSAGNPHPAYDRYGVVVFDLQALYHIGQVDVWSFHNDDPSAGNQWKCMDYFDILLSADGVNYTPAGRGNNTNSNSTTGCSETVGCGAPGMAARYVKIRMHNTANSVQLIVGEVAIWGWKADESRPVYYPEPDPVRVSVSEVSGNSAQLSWSDYDGGESGVTQYKVYVSQEEITDVSALTPVYVTADATERSYVVTGLTGNTTYYAAVIAVGRGGESALGQTVTFTTKGTLYRLTPNKGGDTFESPINPPSAYLSTQPVLDTGVTFSWPLEEAGYDVITEGRSSADKEANIFNGNERSFKPEFYYAMGWKANAYGKYAPVIFDLKKPYKISQIDVWAMCNDTNPDTNKRRMADYLVQFSSDGIHYSDPISVTNDLPFSENRMVNTQWTDAEGVEAQYVKLILHNDPDSVQLQVGEIALWGYELD